MNKLISQIAALGIPGLVLLVAINASGVFGGAAIMVALSSIGPGGAIGGIITLGFIGLIAHGISEYGFEKIVNGVMCELYAHGEDKESLKSKVAKMPITHSLKLRLYEVINQFS